MKTDTFKIPIIVLTTITIGFFSCTRDLEAPDVTNDGILTRGADIGEFFYTAYKGKKTFFNIRKDRVIIKTNSETEAKELCKQDVFLSDRPAYDVAYVWVLASIDPEKTNLDDLLKLPGVVDATYGLECEDGILHYPTNRIYIKLNEGLAPERGS
ncbi:MAG: hypothetical protein LBV32_02595 [Tannerellaceae bacterium]|jgi:hypothetical protein|nr:hypothetical protein [Tannerellaceae bacterium]